MKAYVPIVITLMLMAGCQSPPPAPSPVVIQPKPSPMVISRAVTSHPLAYRNKGRPAWTYDENRFHEDIQGEANLVEELREPDEYHFFLGAQTVFVGTEENARSGAQIDVINNFKAFLQTTGRNHLQERRGAGLGQQDVREFQTRMDAAATAESRQLKPVRWYLEEERTEWSDGRTETKWRAWCLAAFSRDRANEVWKRMLDRDDAQTNVSAPALPSGLPSEVQLIGSGVTPDGTIVLTIYRQDGVPRLLVKRSDGTILFHSPVATEMERSQIPREVFPIFDRVWKTGR
jgi:hypothetical protein